MTTAKAKCQQEPQSKKSHYVNNKEITAKKAEIDFPAPLPLIPIPKVPATMSRVWKDLGKDWP